MEKTEEAGTGRRGSLRPLLLTVLLAALFATGVGGRPGGAAWDRAYDVVLFNLPFLAAATACFSAARRVRIERVGWGALGGALTLSALGNALRVLAAGPGGNGRSLLADLVALSGYLTLYVVLIGMIRPRVLRFHPSMWLDGVIGAFGSLSVAVAFVLGPLLHPGSGRPAVAPMALVGPVTDVLLIAVLVAVGSILGVRLDRTLLMFAGGLCVVCTADIAVFVIKLGGTRVDGGPLELCWLACVVAAAWAAVSAQAPTPPEDHGGGSRLGWRLLAVPLSCTLLSLLVVGSGSMHPIPATAVWLAIACVLAGILRTAVTFREVRGFAQARYEARTDELTGLANRRALLEAAERVVAEATATSPASLLLLDLDGFKEVNDSLGHPAGDDLLRQVGHRVRDVLRAQDVLARLGGDEFAVLLPGTAGNDAGDLGGRLRDLLLRPFTVAGERLHVGVSIGVTTTRAPATTVEQLLQFADLAMYAAKKGREGVHAYAPDPVVGTLGSGRLRTMEDLRAALPNDELLVHLQPQADLRNGTTVGVEALVRWQHPTRGLLFPAELLPAAEQAGLMRPLTDRVLELALAAAARWWSDHEVPVSVNLSPANVSDRDLPEKVATALLRHGMPARALTLELVEDTVMADPERGRTVLVELRRMGVRTSIDDYGTGYSSLAYLRHLPVDELKLDRSLTADVDRDPRAANIVEHTVALAHSLGLSLVAEGMESPAAGAVLAGLGCDAAQGYAIARPMPVADFLEWLDAAESAASREETVVSLLGPGGAPTQVRM